MNRPTPNPSREGSRHSSASCPFPSREGLGVGSWSQCTPRLARRSADFSPPPAVSPGRQQSGLKSALLNSMAVRCSAVPGLHSRRFAASQFQQLLRIVVENFPFNLPAWRKAPNRGQDLCALTFVA